MNWKKVSLILALSATALALLAGGFVWWRGHVARNAEQHAFARAEQLLRDGQPAATLALVDRHPSGKPPLDWTGLEIRALAGARHIPRLVAWHEREPQRVEQDEDATLLVARAYLHARQTANFKKLRQLWQPRERQPERWTILDADALMLVGKAREAEKILLAATFPTNAEPQRLSRLAILQAPRDPNAAWNLLDRAYTLDPRNTDIRSFRAQLLESASRFGDARVEYVAAHLAEPDNPLLRDQLAEFYTRQRSFDFALQTWREAVAIPSIEAIWLKLAFWGRVVQPSFLENLTNQPPAGRLQPLTQLLLSLPPDRFFDTNQFNLLPGAQRLASERPEVFWLQVLEALRTGAETNALDLLGQSRANGPTAPELSAALKTILAIRLSRPSVVGSWSRTGNATNRHQFFTELAAYAAASRAGKPIALLPETEAIVRGPNAFAAACLGAGWREAALRLLRETPAATRPPEWFPYGIAQTLRFNRRSRAALDYIAKQPPTSALTLLAAELELGDGQIKPGLARLETLAREDSDVGFRAAWLLSLANLDMNKIAVARATVAAQPRLANSSTGQELLARAALGEGKTNETDRIYRTIEKDSIEAQAWLLRQDMAAKNFDSARRRAAALREAVPEAMETRDNQERVAAAAAKK